MQLCNACRRHVKASPCPFCGGAEVRAVSAASGSGLSRTQMLAGVALASAVAVGCTEKPSVAPAGSSGTPESVPQTVYGAPPEPVDSAPLPPPVTPDGGHAARPDHPPTRDTMPPAPAYGGPPPGVR